MDFTDQKEILEEKRALKECITIIQIVYCCPVWLLEEIFTPVLFPLFSCDSYLLLKNLQRHSKTGKLDTIAHGELWDRNLLMLDDKVKILDWKNAKLASATLDLAFLMLSSTTSDVRQTCTNDLLKSYHKVFCETLEKFGVSTEEQPSFAEIMEDYQISLQAAILQVSTT